MTRRRPEQCSVELKLRTRFLKSRSRRVNSTSDALTLISLHSKPPSSLLDWSVDPPTMSNLITSTIPFLFTVIPLAAWIRSLNQLVPDPYLDEFFHIPQAQVYWRGNFSHWDDKITTPPGLYFFSYVWHSILARLPSQAPTKADLSTQDLRTDGFVIWLALQGTVWLYQRLERKSGRDVRWSSGGTRKSSSGKTWAILAFPLIFFFSGLYYTDVWSAVTVLATMCAWRASTQSRGVTRFMLQLLQVVLGLVSLGSRQTNVFWVVVFTGGLQAVETVSITTPIRNPSIDESSVEGKSNQNDSFHSFYDNNHSDSNVRLPISPPLSTIQHAPRPAPTPPHPLAPTHPPHRLHSLHSPQRQRRPRR